MLRHKSTDFLLRSGALASTRAEVRPLSQTKRLQVCFHCTFLARSPCGERWICSRFTPRWAPCPGADRRVVAFLWGRSRGALELCCERTPAFPCQYRPGSFVLLLFNLGFLRAPRLVSGPAVLFFHRHGMTLSLCRCSQTESGKYAAEQPEKRSSCETP